MTKTELEELRKLKHKIMRRLLDEAKIYRNLEKKLNKTRLPIVNYSIVIRVFYKNIQTVKIEFENYLGF